MNEQKISSNTGLIIGIIVVAILVFAGLIWAVLKIPAGDTRGGGETVTFSDAQDPSVGPVGAKVVVRLYGDFQCPACKFAEPAIKYVREKYGSQVQFIWKDFPLESIHSNARPAANAARCAEAQGKFWEYHDFLYDKQDDWAKERNPNAKFFSYAETLGLNKETFFACLDSRALDAKVTAGIAEGYRNRVDRTPTFFVNNQRYFAMSIAEWEKAIQSSLVSTVSTSTAP